MKAAVLAVVLSAALIAGCSGNSTTAPSSTSQATVTEFFSGTLAVQGVSFASFTVSQAGTVSLTLASVTTGVTSPTSTTVMGLAVGVPTADGASCTLSASVNAAPDLTAQLTSQAVAGTSCAQVFDVGTLTAPVHFVVRIVHT